MPISPSTHVQKLELKSVKIQMNDGGLDAIFFFWFFFSLMPNRSNTCLAHNVFSSLFVSISNIVYYINIYNNIPEFSSTCIYSNGWLYNCTYISLEAFEKRKNACVRRWLYWVTKIEINLIFVIRVRLKLTSTKSIWCQSFTSTEHSIGIPYQFILHLNELD